MKKKRKKTGKEPAKKNEAAGSLLLKNALLLHDEVAGLKKDTRKLTAENKDIQERVQDIEIHVNLLTRLLTTLCIEKFGMRVGVLKRLIKRIEKEAVRDSQILHLESLYKMSQPPKKKDDPQKPSSDQDPWEDIS